MAYIGSQPRLGNFQACDAITTSATATFNLLVGGVAIFPQSAQHCLVSLNGVLQAPISSYTISGSTIIFASALTTDDSIDFITILGDTLDLGTPSDGTVATTKIAANAVTGAKLNTDIISAQTALAAEPADTDEFLVSDAGVLKRIDYSLIKGGGSMNLISTTTVSSGTSTVDITGMDSTYKNYKIILTNLHPATDNVSLNCRFIIGGSAQTGAYYNYVNHVIQHAGTVTHVLNSSGDATSAKLIHSSQGNANVENMSGEITIFNPSETTFAKMLQADISYMNTSAASSYNINTTYYTNGTAAMTGIQFLMSSGNIDNAIFKLYGIS